MVQESNKQFPPVPRSIATAKRLEIDDAEMEIIEGELPDDLQGYVFMVAPAGTIDSGGLPFPDGNTFLNGDGMIYRLDFTQKGQVKLKTKLVKPPDYLLDEAIEKNRLFALIDPFKKLRTLIKFRNHGIARFSYVFGSRNLLNTAFLPIKFSGDSNERLLVTYDAGRPYEIDTETLSLLNPIGQQKEWRAAVPLPYLFKVILTTAHPAFDTHKQEMFTVNYGRSLKDFLETEEGRNYQDILRRKISRKEIELQRLIKLFLETLIPITDTDFVYLMRWDSTNRLKTWELIDMGGKPIRIQQSMHQIGLTEDYVVLMDTSFTVGLEQIINLPLPLNQELEARLRELFTLKPLPDSTFYIVRRDNLQEGNDSVVAQKIVIPREACHFLVDYKNPGDKITLHVAHICAWHVGEWLRTFDKSPYDGETLPEYIHGMQQSAMDISQMGRYEIDVSGQEPEIASQKVITDDTYTWGAGLFAYFDRLPSSGLTPERLDNIYWISYGLWKDLTTDFMYDLYKEYKYREKSREEVLRLAEEGIPATLFRLNTSSNEAMAIADSYQFPSSHLVLSPQFLPRKEGEESSTNGYIVCAVFTPKGDELWIFEAGYLNKGPLCKLAYPQLNFGLSLHTTWLQNISFQPPRYNYSAREDYQELVGYLGSFFQEFFSYADGRRGVTDAEDLTGVTDEEVEELKQEIERLFEEEIYPQFE